MVVLPNAVSCCVVKIHRDDRGERFSLADDASDAASPR